MSSATTIPDPTRVHRLDPTKQFILLDITRHSWPGRRALAGAVVRQTVGAGEEVSLAHVKGPEGDLIPVPIRRQITASWADVDMTLATYTQHFPLGGLRVVALESTGRFFPELEAADRRRAERIEAVLGRYAEIVQHNRDYWIPRCGEEAYMRHIHPLIPTRSQMRQRFRLEVLCRRWEGATEVRVAAEAQAYVDHALAATRARVDEAIEQILVGPRQQLTAALEALRQQLTSGQRLTPASFNQLREAITLCRNFASTVDPETMAQAGRLEALVDRAVAQAVTTNANDARVSLTATLQGFAPTLVAAADQVVAAANDATATAAIFGRFGRRRIAPANPAGSA